MSVAKRKLLLLKENTLVLAAVISLAIHLVAFTGWKLGNHFGWWKHQSMPAWLQKLSQALAKTPDAKKLFPPAKNEVPLIFVDVDPQAVAKEAPKETKFYGAANTQAASEKKADSNLPEITGKQEKILKTTENEKPKPQPLQPSPTKPTENEVEESKPKKQEPIGDLAVAKPQEKSKTGEGEKEQETRPRPRTLAEAKRNLAGGKMKQDGGAKRLALQPSFDVKATSFGDYDREFIAAVQQCWYQLLENRNTVPGRIVVEFRLHSDGRISDLRASENTTGNQMLELICTSAIEKPSPYRKWPTEMRRELATDSREVRFTFYYE